jgi:hypothetical protein
MSIYALTLGCPDTWLTEGCLAYRRLLEAFSRPDLPKVAWPTIFSHNVDYAPQGNSLLP